jgi:hypothetical protein
MTATPHTFRRLASATGLAALLAALVLPVTLASARPLEFTDNPSPLTRGAVVDETLDPAIATAITAHQRNQAGLDLRSPDTRDARPSQQLDPAIATAMSARKTALASADRRSPDTLDTAARVKAPVPTASTGSSDGFDWGRFGVVAVGLGAMFVFVGLGGPAIVVTRRGRVKGKGSVPAA